ncbi:hypothetical protein Q0M94_16120 [Deinococcus radiomollis]|uniref:hypothetical protein n=1 Tax=Deinococcus radiomollis TaxID=468916 RepID=UPI0038913CED
MTSAELAQLLSEANSADWESLASALKLADGQPPPRVAWLVQHLSVTKRGHWEAIAATLGTPLPPPELNLNGLCLWEVGQAQVLSAEGLAAPVDYSGARLSVAELLRLNARHTVWHAGQIAALCRGPRLA